jgi:hypothetical protein
MKTILKFGLEIKRMKKFIVICYSLMMEEWCNLVKLFCKPNLFSMEQEIILIDTTAELGQ